MRIIWNENEKRFEAQFSTGQQWENDKAAAMDAGFKTTGPPAWIWYVYKSAALAKLREHRPNSGLTITKEALDAFDHLQVVERRDAELKKFAKEQNKLQKKEQEREKIAAQREDGEEVSPEYEGRRYHPVPEYWEGKHEITRADLPADVMARLDKHESVPQRRAEPIGKCMICGDNLYYPDELPKCMWCEGHGEEQFLEELIV